MANENNQQNQPTNGTQQQPVAPMQQPSQPPEKKSKLKVVLIVIGVLVVLGIIAGAMGNGSGNNNSSSTNSASTNAAQSANSGSSNSNSTDSGSTKKEKYTVTDEAADTSNMFSYKITGTLTNNTDKKASYVQVQYVLKDASGAQVGTALANTNDLAAGGTWKFEAYSTVSPDKVASFERTDVTGF